MSYHTRCTCNGCIYLHARFHNSSTQRQKYSCFCSPFLSFFCTFSFYCITVVVNAQSSEKNVWLNNYIITITITSKPVNKNVKSNQQSEVGKKMYLHCILCKKFFFSRTENLIGCVAIRYVQEQIYLTNFIKQLKRKLTFSQFPLS